MENFEFSCLATEDSVENEVQIGRKVFFNT